MRISIRQAGLRGIDQIRMPDWSEGEHLDLDIRDDGKVGPVIKWYSARNKHPVEYLFTRLEVNLDKEIFRPY